MFRGHTTCKYRTINIAAVKMAKKRKKSNQRNENWRHPHRRPTRGHFNDAKSNSYSPPRPLHPPLLPFPLPRPIPLPPDTLPHRSLLPPFPIVSFPASPSHQKVQRLTSASCFSQLIGFFAEEPRQLDGYRDHVNIMQHWLMGKLNQKRCKCRHRVIV